MATATLTTKGQITIPASVRVALGLASGDRVEFVQLEPGHFELVAATQPVASLKGMVGIPAKPVSLADMNAAIAKRGAASR